MRYRDVLLELGRILIGLVFVSSAFLKGVDPVGLGIKIQEHLTVMFGIGTSALLSLSDLLSYGLIVLEFCTGAFLLMGIYRRLSSRVAFALLLGFTLTTGYSYFSGLIPDCGCFGDAFKLSPLQTFLKNLMLLPISVFLVKEATQIRHLYSFREQWLPALFSFIAISVFVYINGKYLPIWDFRPYKIGYNIRERIATADSLYQAELLANTRYVYEREGKRRSFAVDSLPDSTWRYIEMQQSDVLNSKPLTYNLLILSQEGEDMTDEILGDESGVFLFTSPDWSKAEQTNYEHINELYRYTQALGLKFYSLTPSKADSEAEWRYQTGAEYPGLFVDATTLKTMIRSNPGLVILKGGRIMDKVAVGDFPKSDEIANFVQERLEGTNHTRASLWRLFPLGIWATLLFIGLIRRVMRLIRALFYIKAKPQTKEHNNKI